MTSEKQRIPKLIITPRSIETPRGWNIAQHDNLCSCYDCNSNLFYVTIYWGVVANEDDFQVTGNRSKTTYALREVGLRMHCAECGEFLESYSKFFYPEDKMILELGVLDDELSEDERAEIWNCLLQWNQKGSFESRYKSPVFTQLREKLIEYEKKHPIKNENKIKSIPRKKRR